MAMKGKSSLGLVVLQRICFKLRGRVRKTIANMIPELLEENLNG